MTIERVAGIAPRLLFEIRRRLLPHGLVIFLLWPIVSVLVGAVILLENPVTGGVPFLMLIAGAAGGAWKLATEFLVAASALSIASTVLSASVATADRSLARGTAEIRSQLRLGAEPVLFFFAALLGTSLEYPALLRHPLISPVRPLSVATALLALATCTAGFAALLGRQQSSPRRAVLMVAAVGLVTVLSWRLSRPLSDSPPIQAGSNSSVLLGLDSISQTDDVSLLRRETERLGGIWYEKPVPPGLLTNSVWPSIIMGRPPHETGVFMVFQTLDWSRAPHNIVMRAHENGCATFAYLETGFTAYVGSSAGFDVDRSGPRGWLQPATAAVKDASVLLPLLLARVPPIPGAITPPNQTGTFNYDMRREIRDILTQDTPGCSFVAGHLDYLHQTRFPSFSEMNRAERRAVRQARAGAIHDLSLEWQFPLLLVDPLKLYTWKIAYVQRVVSEEIDGTGFLDPKKGNRLIIFSDHGNRRGITEDNFGRARYHRVVLATFGVPARDPRSPVSLLDIPAMLGLGDPTRPERADPVVEYTNATGNEWRLLIESARLRFDGEVFLDPAIVRGIGARLRGFRPYSSKEEYFPSPVGMR